MKTPIERTQPSPTITPSTTSERAPMKQLSSMMVGIGLQRLEHAADADAAGKMHVLADLRAGADGGPGVHHRALVDIGAEIHEGRHQDDVRRDIGAAADDAARDGAEARLRGTRLSPQPSNLEGTLSHQVARAGAAGNDGHVVEAEGQQHRLLQPLMDAPAVIGFFCDADLAGIEEQEGGLDRLAHDATRAGADIRPVLEGCIDGAGEIGLGHCGTGHGRLDMGALGLAMAGCAGSLASSARLQQSGMCSLAIACGPVTSAAAWH